MLTRPPSCENYQHFAFIIGISKFSKVSVFSDRNNLTDLTMMPRAAILLGYTHDEMKANFANMPYDISVQVPEQVYEAVMRRISLFKRNECGFANAARAQLWEKGNAKSHLVDGRPVWMVGFAFDSRPPQLIDAKDEHIICHFQL